MIVEDVIIVSDLGKKIDASDQPNTTKKLRFSLPFLDWKEYCFICGNQAIVDSRHPDRMTVHNVETLCFRATNNPFTIERLL